MKTFGSDPELMVKKNDEPVSAIGIIHGDIENRITIKGHQFYCDNVLAECAIKPGSSKKEVLENFKECLSIYAEMVNPFQLAIQASADFSDEQLMHPGARKVGCSKDFCAYEMVQKEAPINQIQNGNLRSCGGHIHLGADILTGDGAEPILAVYMMDLFLGVPSLWLDKDPSSVKRRSIYGQAGRYRVKDYGIEYRSLGNFWLKSPELVDLVYDISMFCVEFVENGNAWDLWEFDIERMFETNVMSDSWKCLQYDSKALMKGINETDRDAVIEHFELAKSLMPKKLRDKLQKLIDKPEEKDFYQNWKLKL
jgi:hypothetical protein